MNHISISLTEFEALVLYHWLTNTQGLVEPNSAEQIVAWKIEGALEKQLVQVLQPDYLLLVDNAKRQVQESH